MRNRDGVRKVGLSGAERCPPAALLKKAMEKQEDNPASGAGGDKGLLPRREGQSRATEPRSISSAGISTVRGG